MVTAQIPPRLVAGIIIVVTTAFAVTFGAQFFIPDYQPETAIYGMFSAFAVAAIAQRRNKGDDQ